MHWESFYVIKEDINGDELLIRGDEHRHLSRTLRKRRGDIIWAVDGEGGAYQTELIDFSKTVVRGKILKRRRRVGEPAAEVILFQAVLKGDRMDWLVEKATELGVHTIVPVLSERTKAAAGENRCRRWERLALAAMKQCGRSFRPVIAEPMAFEHAVVWGGEWTARLLAEAGPESREFTEDLVKTATWPRIGLWVGPEGGFSETEVKLALDSGLYSITLGRRRLRAETAGLTLLTQTMDRLGELRE